MNTNASPDELDRLLSGYFKAQMQRPWPAAPVPTQSEPAELVAVRNTTTAASPASDHTTRSRITLAASVAILLGSCWYLSNGLEQGHRPAASKPSPGGEPGMLPDGMSQDPEILSKVKEIKATQPQPDPADMPMPPIKDAFGKQP